MGRSQQRAAKYSTGLHSLFNIFEKAQKIQYITHGVLVIYLLHFTLKSATHALALKPKPLVVRSRDRGRDQGLLKKWHCLPRLWHRLPRLSALVTESEVTAQSLPCAVFAPSLIPNDKDFLFA